MGVSGAPEAEKDLARFLRMDAQVISQKDYIRVATQIGATGTEPDDVAKVAAKLHAAAILAGKVEKEHGVFALRLVLREGASGRVVAKLRYSLSKPRLDTKVQDQLRQDLLPVIAQAVAPGGGVGAEVIDASTASEDSGAVAGGKPGSSTPAAPAGMSGGPDDENPLIAARAKAAHEGGGSVAKDREEEPSGPRPAWRTVMELSAGIGFQGRNYSTSASSEPTYSSGQIPNFRLDATLYPAASLGKAGAAIGIDAHYDQSVSFQSNSPSMPNANAPTTESAFGIGVRGRWIVREAADSPVLWARLGYGQRKFAITGDTDLGIPEIDYSFADVGVGAKIPLGSPNFAIDLAAGYQAVMNAGPIVDASQYGAATVSGLRAEGGLEIMATDWLQVRGGASYQRYSFSFTGGGMRMADSATDEYIGGYLMAGYVY